MKRSADIKWILQLSVPVLLVLAMFAVYRISPDSRMAYSDIAGSDYAEDILRWTELGVMSGTDGKFRPDDAVKTSELCTIFTRILPLNAEAGNTYTDLTAGAWYESAVLRCAAAGIVYADEAGAIHPTDALTREAAALMFARAFHVAAAPEPYTALGGMNDAKRVSAQAAPFLETMLREDLIPLQNAVQLYPQQELTRGELAAMLSRFCDVGYFTAG